MPSQRIASQAPKTANLAMQDALDSDSIKVKGNLAGTPAIESAALFKGTREIVIDHNGEFYRLRITRQGKLILNK